MKKTLITLVILLLASAATWSQSLEDNEYYQKMLELRSQSQVAFDEGDYAEANRLAVEAQSFREQSELWILTQLAAYRARASLNRLKDRLAQVKKWNAETNFPDEYAEGMSYYDRSFIEFFDDEDYIISLATSIRGYEILSVISYIASDMTLPAYYVVRLLPGNTDCLWNIAGYEFIYNDPWSWRKIYDANRDKLPEADNPDLILPEMVLTIPAIGGETRSGTWDDGVLK